MPERIITINDYDPTWPDQFDRIHDEITGALGQLVADVQHIGSTAVPDLPAKPIIDVLVGIWSLPEFDATGIKLLVDAGYEYVSIYEADLPMRRYFRKWNADFTDHSVHIHVTVLNNNFWDRHILFRDYLRNHPAIRDEYASLKRGLLPEFSHNTAGYTDAKTDFITRIENKALIWRARQDEIEESI